MFFFYDSTRRHCQRLLSRGKQIHSRRAKCIHGTRRQLRDSSNCQRNFIFLHAARKNFGRGDANKLGVHFNGVVDNGRGSGVRDDLSVGRRIVDSVADCEHFNRVGNAVRRRIFLSRANHSAKNFRRGTVHRGCSLVVEKLTGRVNCIRLVTTFKFFRIYFLFACLNCQINCNGVEKYTSHGVL